MGTSYDKDPSPYLRQSVAENPYRLLEWTTFLEVLGSVKGLDLLDLACGDGRLTRVLTHRGARRIVGIDISTQMIVRAEQQNRSGESEAFPELIEYRVLSASDIDFQLSRPVRR
jgi:2-polyprenyl-3-methyl-5-hydroxy-6-metoxy-1,4-benzoquinol methylase